MTSKESQAESDKSKKVYFTQFYFSHVKDWIWEDNSKDDYKLSWE